MSTPQGTSDDGIAWKTRAIFSSAFLVGVLVTVGGCTGAESPPKPELEMSSEAYEYLSEALDTLELVAIHAESVDWEAIRDSALLVARGARRTADTYAALNWALRRANKHSFLQAGSRGATVSQLIESGVGYIRIPPRGGVGQGLADSLHASIGDLQRDGACAWIVDLRANGGGNMWPMLAGIGPLLGSEIVGGLGSGSEADRWSYVAGVSGIVRPDGSVDTISNVTVPVVELDDPSAPVAVLVDGGTGSSGEAIAIAFIGRPNTRSFGSATAGFATVNRGVRLSDGANMVVTTGYNADRFGQVVEDLLIPDSVLDGPPPGWPSPTDRVAMTAVGWLRTKGTCF